MQVFYINEHVIILTQVSYIIEYINEHVIILTQVFYINEHVIILTQVSYINEDQRAMAIQLGRK